MRVLVIDSIDCGVATDFCMRCQQAGHEVMWYSKPRKDGTWQRAGEGIVDKLRDFDELRKKWLGWADLIFLTDNTTYLNMLEPYRAIGYPIFGPSEEAARWELDRAYGQQVFSECGIDIIEGEDFRDYDSAIAYVKKHGRAFVSKPNGDANKALSYVSQNAADLVYMLGRWKKNPKYVEAAKRDGFILQEKISGIEFAVGGWFGPSGFTGHWYENAEHKKLMNGDLGVNTGEMGTLSMYVTRLNAESKTGNAAIPPIITRWSGRPTRAAN